MKAWGSVALGSMMVLVLACDSGGQDDSTAGSDAAAGLPTLRIDSSAGGVCVPLTCAGSTRRAVLRETAAATSSTAERARRPIFVVAAA